MEQLDRAAIEAMFRYLDDLEKTWTPATPRTSLGLPFYRFHNPRSAAGRFPLSKAPVKFVFIANERGHATAPGGNSGHRPAGTLNDPATCLAKGLCFPNLVRQELTLAGQDLVLTRNLMPYGINHGLVRSVLHEPQSECFEPHRLRVALRLAQLLGASYEVWIAGEGLNTQWHFHVQFRQNSHLVWPGILARQPVSGQRIESFPSRPWYFEESSEPAMVERIASVASGGAAARGLLIVHESGVWRALFVRSNPAGRLFNKPLGLNEHLGEVILENETEFIGIQQDVPAAAAQLEQTLLAWCR